MLNITHTGQSILNITLTLASLLLVSHLTLTLANLFLASRSDWPDFLTITLHTHTGRSVLSITPDPHTCQAILSTTPHTHTGLSVLACLILALASLS